MQASDVMPCLAGTLPRSSEYTQQWRVLGADASRRAAAVLARHCRKANRQPSDQSVKLDPRTQMLLQKPIATTMVRLAIPNGIVMAVQILIGLLEVYFISRLGVDALGGVAPVFPLVSLLVAVSQGAIGGGIVTAVGRAVGTGRIVTASDYTWYAVALAVPLGLATTVVMLALGPSLYARMGLSGNALAIATSYSAIVFAGAILVWLFNFLMAVVRGTGNMMVPVLVVCAGTLILVPLSPALIFGAFGYQGLGPSGGAVALLVYYAIGTLAYAAYLWGRFGILKPSIALPKLSLEPALAILRVGGMSTVVSATTNLTLAIVTAYVAFGGVEALAGYGAASRLEFLLVPLAYSVGGPVGIIVSANLGAGKIDRAVKASWLGVLMGCVLTELVGLAAASFPHMWIGMFSQDPDVLRVGADYLHRVGPFFGFFGVGYVLYCAGQATKRMGASVFAALIRAAIAVLGGLAAVWFNADVTWNFIAVALGMIAFGLFALPPLVTRSAYK